jgi:hypothetical protein
LNPSHVRLPMFFLSHPPEKCSETLTRLASLANAI